MSKKELHTMPQKLEVQKDFKKETNLKKKMRVYRKETNLKKKKQNRVVVLVRHAKEAAESAEVVASLAREDASLVR